jgi:hypothetical protein
MKQRHRIARQNPANSQWPEPGQISRSSYFPGICNACLRHDRLLRGDVEKSVARDRKYLAVSEDSADQHARSHIGRRARQCASAPRHATVLRSAGVGQSWVQHHGAHPRARAGPGRAEDVRGNQRRWPTQHPRSIQGTPSQALARACPVRGPANAPRFGDSVHRDCPRSVDSAGGWFRPLVRPA